MRRTTAIAVAAAFIAGGLIGLLVYVATGLSNSERPVATVARPAWTEVQWPFAIDQWGRGKAYRCKAADCGVEVNVYVRAKIGFCNCTTGVADDQELERVSDRELLGDKTVAQKPGREIKIAWMKGRSRVYTGLNYQPKGATALAIAYNDRCDVIVATAVVPGKDPLIVEPAVLDFLNSKPVMSWAERTLGL
jgi:hypothetical protein